MWKQRLQDLQLAVTLAAVVGKLKMADILNINGRCILQSWVLINQKLELQPLRQHLVVSSYTKWKDEMVMLAGVVNHCGSI